MSRDAYHELSFQTLSIEASPVVNPTTSLLSDVSTASNMIDSDVLEEQDRVLQHARTGDVLLMKGVTKVFQVQGWYSSFPLLKIGLFRISETLKFEFV